VGVKPITDLHAPVFAGAVPLQVRFEDVVVLSPALNAVIFAGRERGSRGDLELAIRITLLRLSGDLGGWRHAHHYGSIDDPEQLRRYQQAVVGRGSARSRASGQ
jgi:hypothetical protein